MTPASIRALRQSFAGRIADAALLVGVDARTWERWELGVVEPAGGGRVVLAVLLEAAGRQPEATAAWCAAASARGGLAWVIGHALEAASPAAIRRRGRPCTGVTGDHCPTSIGMSCVACDSTGWVASAGGPA